MKDSIFELSDDEAGLLFSIEKYLTEMDIIETNADDPTGQALKKYKQDWLNSWSRLIVGKYSKFDQEKNIKGPGLSVLDLQYFSNDEAEIVNRLKKLPVRKRTLVLFEVLVFTPYFNLNIRELPVKDGARAAKGMRDSWKKRLFKLASDAQIDESHLEVIEKNYKKAISEISGKKTWKKMALVMIPAIGFAIVGGVAAPAIGSLIGGWMGLYGAAATSAGLALLGGGAISAGGLGMAGGTAVIIGGGAFFGGSAGAFFSSRDDSLVSHPDIILSQLSKLEAVLNSILIDDPAYSDYLDEALDGHANVRKSLLQKKSKVDSRLETVVLEEDQKKNLKKLQNDLSKIVGYYETAIKRINDLILELKLR